VNNFEHQVFGRVQLNDYSTGNLAANQTNLYAGTGTHFDSIQKLFPNKEVKKMAKNTRGLYQVILVNPKEGKIIFTGFVICDKVEDVLLEADAGKIIKEANLQVSEVDKIINLMGEIRKAKRNKDGVLEIVQEEEK